MSFAKFLEVKNYVLYNVKYDKGFMFLSMVHQCLASFRKTVDPYMDHRHCLEDNITYVSNLNVIFKNHEKKTSDLTLANGTYYNAIGIVALADRYEMVVLYNNNEAVVLIYDTQTSDGFSQKFDVITDADENTQLTDVQEDWWVHKDRYGKETYCNLLVPSLFGTTIENGSKRHVLL